MSKEFSAEEIKMLNNHTNIIKEEWYKSGYSIVKAKEAWFVPCMRKYGDRLVFLVPCPFCKEIHTHGLREGLRCSHCTYYTESYYIVEVNK